MDSFQIAIISFNSLTEKIKDSRLYFCDSPNNIFSFEIRLKP